MKIACMVVSSFLFSTLLQAQDVGTNISLDLTTGKYRSIYNSDFSRFSDSRTAFAQSTPSDMVPTNMYGNLLNDNPAYNKRAPFWRPVVAIIGTNVVTNLTDTYILQYDYSRVGIVSWRRNLKAGFPWDRSWIWAPDRFGMNFFMHPYGGGAFFNAARANGYTFWESAPFVLLGSYMWKIFGETGAPERNSLVATTFGGIFLGEIFYRLGSNILDDQTTGANRFFREFAVAIISPTRFTSRLLNGYLTRVTPDEVYQKEPINVTLSGGYHRVNEGTHFSGGGNNSVNLDMMVDYGNPFEKVSRKPFDYFKIRGDIDFGVGRKIVDAVTGDGILYGSNVQAGSLEMLIGLFDHMNYFDNWTFELGTFAFGPSVISKVPMSAKSSLYTNIHVGIVPFGALSNRFGPDTSQLRDYDFGGGAETKLETTYNFGGWVGVTFLGYYWLLHTYSGVAENSYIGLIKPSIAFKIFDNISLGYEHSVYYSDRYPTGLAATHTVRTEEKIFLQMFLENLKF